MRLSLRRHSHALSGLVGLSALFAATPLRAVEPPDPIEIHRVSTPIEIDGDLSDAAWKQTTPITTWFETNPGDSIVTDIKSTAWLAYDDHFFYAAFDFEDPDPKQIRAPLGDHDQIGGSFADYGGVIVDPRNDGKTAQMFLANPHGLQYDALTSDTTGEDSSPDFFWDAAGKITERGWSLEIRVPFSSIRYADPNPKQWRILLYRNRGRNFRYQYFTSKLPRNVNCFICNSRPLVGLANLPSGSHWIAAPYLSATRTALPKGDLGTPLENRPTKSEAGIDAKWIPNPNLAVDGTINPDFSQIESDTAQITANERFALFFPEKRPFFLEGIDIFALPMQAIYTRTFTAPRFGLRATGSDEKTKYTILAGEDKGGGLAILPGAFGSNFAPLDFKSWVTIGRVRREFDHSFFSFVYSGRESAGGAHNRVFGPDFEWRPNAKDQFVGEFLASTTKTPNRPDLATEWDGRAMTGDAERFYWSHGDTKWDWFGQLQHISDEFRADNGFIPQVGFSDEYVEVGRTYRPTGKAITRLRLSTFAEEQDDDHGRLIYRQVTPALGFDALWNSFVRFEFHFEKVGTPTAQFSRFQLKPYIEIRPNRLFSDVILQGTVGDDVDFVGNRKGRGWTVNLSGDIRPTDHLILSPILARRVLDVELPDGGHSRLFTADIARLRTVYTFNSRLWLRLVGQWIGMRQNPALYTDVVPRKDASFSGSGVLAYKLNWQTVAYLGYGDDRALDENERLVRAGRQIFAKISYAFQH